jgi:hypothetical protein
VPSRIVSFNANPKFHYTAKDAGGPAWSALMPSISPKACDLTERLTRKLQMTGGSSL